MGKYNIIVLVAINLIFMLGWVAILGNPYIQEGKKKVKKGWLKHLVRNRRLTPLEIRKQWNLVALQLNGLVAWIIHLFS